MRASGKASVERWWSTVAWAWLAAGLISGVIGLFQYYGGAGSFSPWVNLTEVGQAFANLRQRNQFASLINIAFAATLWLGVTDRFAGRSQWLVWAAAALLATGNAASSSRTGLLQLLLLCALFWVWNGWRQPRVRRVLLAAVLAYGVAMLVLPWLAGLDVLGYGIVARLRAGDDVCVGRFTLWSNVLDLIVQKPWLGWGWGELDYAHYMTLYSGERFCDILDNAHNLPLHLAVELGVPLALGVCGAFLGLMLHARPLGETDPARQMAWGVLALILLHSLVEYPLWYGPFQIAAGLCVYLLWTTRARQDQTRCSPPGAGAGRTGVVRLLTTTAALTMAVTAYAGWDYHRVSQIYLAPALRDPAYRDNTLEKIRDTYLFRRQFDFAALSVTPLTPANALEIHALAMDLLHYSPEPRVIEKVIESAVMLRRDDEALLHLARYKAAFPKNHAQWRQALTPTGLAKD